MYVTRHIQTGADNNEICTALSHRREHLTDWCWVSQHSNEKVSTSAAMNAKETLT